VSSAILSTHGLVGHADKAGDDISAGLKESIAVLMSFIYDDESTMLIGESTRVDGRFYELNLFNGPATLIVSIFAQMVRVRHKTIAENNHRRSGPGTAGGGALPQRKKSGKIFSGKYRVKFGQ